MPSVGRMKFPHIEEPGLRDRVQRYFMAIFCFLYFVLGVSVIMCGGLLLARRQLECSYMAQYYSGVCLLLAAGCVTSFFSMCGCLVMRRTNASHYYTPLLLVLIIVLVMEVAAAVSSHILCHIATSGQLEEEMQSARDKFWTSSGSAECLNRLQTDFECCGVTNYSEWNAVFTNSSNHDVFPSSCICGSNRSSCMEHTVLTGNISENVWVWWRPCYSLVVDDIFDSLLITRIVGPVVVVVKVIVLLMVIFFLHHISNRSLVGAYIVNPSQIRPPSNSNGEAPSLGETDAGWVQMQERQKGQLCLRGGKPVGAAPESISFSRDESAHM